MVVSEISPMLSPKHAPPAIAQVVRSKLPVSMQFGSTICTSHKKIGAHAANVPHEVPVATDKIAVTTRPTTAVVFAEIPSDSAIFTTDAPTPVDMNALAIAYANIKINRATVMLLTLFVAASIQSLKLSPSVTLAMMTAATAAIGAARSASCPAIIKPASMTTGTNLTVAFKNFILFSPFLLN